MQGLCSVRVATSVFTLVSLGLTQDRTLCSTTEASPTAVIKICYCLRKALFDGSTHRECIERHRLDHRTIARAHVVFIIITHQTWSVIINAALGGQVVFAALLTALGASNGSHTAIAILGTMNTIIAGFLTYLKGTGLPMRMKYFHNQWLKLRAYIEQRERDFASDDLSQVHRITYEELIEEVDIVEKMYHNIRKDVEKHPPEAFGDKDDDGSGEAPGEGAPAASLASRGLSAAKNKVRGKNFAEDLEARVGSRSRNTKPPAKEKSNGKAALDDLDEEDGEEDEVTKLASERARVLQERAETAQEQAEKRVKELEARFASLEKSKT